MCYEANAVMYRTVQVLADARTCIAHTHLWDVAVARHTKCTTNRHNDAPVRGDGLGGGQTATRASVTPYAPCKSDAHALTWAAHRHPPLSELGESKSCVPPMRRGAAPRTDDANANQSVGNCSEASYLERNSAMDDSIGGS